MTMYRGFKSFKGKNKKGEGLLQKAVLTFLMTGVVAWPSFSPVYAASTITDSSGASLINTGDTVHNIYAQQKVNANIGANKFQTFNVDTNNIANLHFRTSSTSTEHFNTLLNFVDNRININGTVNAIRNGKIGGHLFFLSPNGMVVGASGAINTGSLTVMAPTTSEYNTLKGLSDASVAKITATAADIPLNPSGTIVVRGNINATNDVRLRAGQIYVGSNEQNTEYSKAKIETGVENFSDLVKLTGEQQTAAGLTELTAVRDAGTGDISIVSDVQLKNASSSTAVAKIIVDGESEIVAAKDVTILAKVENNANAVEFKDNEGHTKYIVNGEITDTPPSSTGGFMTDRKNDLQAVVKVGEHNGATVKAQKDVKINALVENNFETGMLGGGDILGGLTEIPSILLGIFATGDDAVVGFLKSKAEVDVYENSVIKSVAGDIDILAQAKNKLVLGASVNAFNMMGGINNSVNSLPSLAVTVGSNKTDAVVKVDGTITAEDGKVNIEALGDNTFNTSAAIGTGYGGINPNSAVIAAAVDVAWGHNNAKVEIGSNANITAKKDLAVRATANNAVSIASNIKSKERNDAAFVVDVLEYDSSAEIDVNGELKSQTGNLYVVAEDDFITNSLTASTKGGATSLVATLVGQNAQGSSILPNFIEPLMRKVAEKFPGEYFSKFATYGFSDSGPTAPGTSFQKLMDKIKLGVSVGYMKENNRALVNIAKTAKLTAAEKVDLHAKVYHYGIETKVAGSVDVSSNRQDTATEKLAFMGGGALIIRHVNNSADVIIDGRDAAAEDNIKGRNIAISAETKIESHNVQNKIMGFQNLFKIRMNETEFKNMFTDMNENDLDALWKSYKNYMDLLGKKFFETDASGNVVYGADGLPKVKSDYIKGTDKTNDELYKNLQAAMDELAGKPEHKFFTDLMQGKEVTYRDKHGVERTLILENKSFLSKIIDAVSGVVSAIDASSWVDFNVGSAVSHIYKGEGNNPKFAGNVIVAIDDVSNKANVLIGKNNRIKADNDIVIKTDTFFETAYVDGKLDYVPFTGIVNKMTGSYGLNIMVGLRDLAQNSMIVAAENVQMAAKNLDVEADATAKIVGITEFVVTGAATSAVGSLALALPRFVNNNLISFDDEVKLDVTGEINLTGKNYLNEELIAGGLVSSGKATGALTVQVFNQQRNNLVVVGDNDDTVALISADEKVPELEWNDYTDKADATKNKQKDTDEQRVKKLIALNLLADNTFKRKQDNKDVFDRDKAAGFFGTNSTKINNSISAGSFYSKAMNEGEIVTAVADVALSITGGTLSEADSGPGFFAKLGEKLAPAGQFFMNWVVPTLGAPIYWPMVGASVLGDFLQGNINSWLPAKPNVPGLTYPPDTEVPPVSLEAVGSVSVDTFRVRTASVIDGVKITLTGAEVTKNNKTETVYNLSNIASDTTGMVNVAGSAAVGTKGYSSRFTAQFNDAFEHGGLYPAEDTQDATLNSLSGAAAVGILVNDLTAQVMNSEISNASTFVNEAVREGHLAVAAAAVAASLTTTFTGRFRESTNRAMAGGVSLNFGTFSTLASLKDNLVTGLVTGDSARPTDLSNIAQTQDIQVTGGIDIDIAKGTYTTVGLGGIVSYAAFSNNVTAEIKDDGVNDTEKKRKYTAMGNVENIARTSLTQATMAVGIGLAIKAGTGTDAATVSLQGAAAVNNIANNVFAVNEGITMDAKNLQVMAFDFKKGDISNRLKNWEKSSIDLFRNSTNASINEADKNVTNYNGADISAGKLQENGNLIITGGLELALALGTSEGNNGVAGAALGLSMIDNNFVADVKESNITLTDAVKYDTKDATKVAAYPARVLAESNTEKWGIIAGANASRTEGGVSVTIGGSILLDFMNNDVIAKVEKSNITTDGLCLDAYNKEKYVNATGYFGLAMGGADSSSVGIGLGIVYNKTLNNTAARLLNTDVSAYTPTGSVIGLFADSHTDIYGFAFGAGASNYGLTANVAVNVGQTNVEAIVEDTDDSKEYVLKNVKSLTVQSKDDTYRMAIAGNVNVASTAALGAALTWNRIGHQLTADDKILKDFEKKDAEEHVVQTLVPSALTVDGAATQTNRAKVSGYKVVTIDKAKVDISALDKANFTTISVGAVLNLPNVTSKGSNLAVEGANANSMIDKTTIAELENCIVGRQTLNSESVGSDNVTVNVNASTNNKSLSSSDVLVVSAGSGETRAALGAAVVENTIGANTNAKVTGTYGVKNMLVKSVSNQDLDNYAFGVSATTDLTLGGSVVVNTISGKTTADIGKADGDKSTVNSSGSLGVIAESYEELTNGSGQLAASIGGKNIAASGGASVAVNSISGDTLATVTNADVSALAQTGVAAYAHKDSADMKRKLADKTLQKPEDYVAPTYTGLIVGADAFHHLKDVTACGAVGMSMAGGSSFGIDATVAVDKINGNTKALVTKTNINNNQTSVGNVNVLATDALESYSKVINGGISLSVDGTIGLSVGAGVLVNNNNRTVQSGIGGTDSYILNAKDLRVFADSYADVDLLNVCASFVFSGTGVSVTAGITSADVEETTDAYVKNMSGETGSITVEAQHKDDFDLTGTNLAFAISTELVGVGIGVQVNNLTDKATTNALIDSSNFTHNINNTYTDTVKANNTSDIDAFTYNLAFGSGGVETYGLGGAGIGVMVVNNDLEQITLAKVNNSQLANETNQAWNINVEAIGKEYVDYCGENTSIGTGGGIGVATLLNDINTTTRADVIGAKLYAGNNIAVSADENKQLDNTLMQIAAGALAVGVPVIHNYIGMDVDSASQYTFVDTVKENIDAKDNKKSEKENNLNKISTDNYSFSATKINTLTQEGKNKFGAGNTPPANPLISMAKQGVVVNIDQSILKAGNILNILAKANTNSNATMGGGQVGALNVMVPVNRQRLGENISVNIGSTVSGKTSNLIGTNGVTINGIVSGKMENHTTQVAVSGVGVLVTTTELTKQENKGISISVGGTTIKTEGDLEISTSDTLSLENHLTQVGVGGTDFGAIVSTTQDNSSNKLKLEAGNDFTAKNIAVLANSTPQLSMDNTNVSASAVRGAGMINEVSTKGDTELKVVAGSTMKADKIDLKAQLLTDNTAKHTLKSDIHAVGVSALGIGVDKSRTYSTRNVKTEVGSITLSGFTNPNNVSALTIASYDGTDIDNYIRTTAVGVIASESNFAQSKLLNTVTTSVDTGANTWSGVDTLQITATGNTKVNAHAKGSSGSTLGIMPYAAQVENKIDNDVTLTVKGKYNVGAALFAAEQLNEMQLCADALTVTLVGGAGTRTYNDVTLDTTANITDVTVTAGDVCAYANGMANLNKLENVNNDEKFTDAKANCLVLGNGVGGFDIEVAKGDNKITFNDTLNITNSTFNAANNLILGASSGGILRAQLFDYTVNAIGGGQLRLYNTIKSNNIINFETSHITGTKPEQDITVAACDNLEITAATYTEMTAGAAGATEAKTTNTVERTNKVNLKSGKIYSMRDVNLYAGRDEKGNNGLFTLIARAETYCGALIPFSTNPTLNNNLTQNNEINVESGMTESGMTIQSVRHSNLYADYGTENVKLLEARHSVYRDKTNKDTYVVSENGLPSGVETYNNYVRVDGSITAGISNVVGITIGGTGMFIVKDVNEKNMITAGGSGYTVYTFEEFKTLATGGLDIVADSSSGLTKDKFTLGIADYISNLGDRLEQLKKLVSDAAMSSDKTAYNAYKAELDRVTNLKAKMENIQEGRQLYDAYIVIPDLVASGGNVNVDTGTLYGDGQITAKGTPSITITNNTNLELRINNIIVDEPGGLFNFNNSAISGDVDQIRAAVKKKNVDKSKNVGMGVSVPSAGTDNKITINGNWSGAEVHYGESNYEDPETHNPIHIEAGSMYAVANIEINGNINSKQGDVTIYSAHNDIIIEGKDAANSVNIRGKEVHLNAPYGSITQGFTKGIVSVGGNVQSQFSTLYNNFVNNNIGQDNSTSTYSYTDGGTISRDAGRIDGGEIYINALDININGILQSGYEKYFVVIDSTAQAKIDNLKNSNENNDLSDVAVLGNPKYCVVEGKDVAHGNAGYFDRQIAVYYNPATDTLLTENVDASGGKIYLSGRISSTGSVLSGTGSGAIYCMDGAYNIDITNQLPYDLKTNSLIVNDVSGLVQFTNLETGYKTLIRKNGITYQNSKGDEVSAAEAGSQVYTDNGVYFKPTAGLRYTWSTGYTRTEYKEYEKEFMAKWWGLADAQKVDNNQMKTWASGLTPTKTESDASEDRPNGETIAVNSNGSQVSITHNKTVVESTNRLIDTQRWTTGYLGCHKRWKYTWRETSGTAQSDVISVKADNNIAIKFIGSSADNSYVKVQSTNTGNIVVAGSTGNMLKYKVTDKPYIEEKGKVIIDAQKGAVTQKGGSIYGAAVELSAAEDINITSIVNGHDLTLSANVSQGGSTDITVKDRTDASVVDNISNIKIAKLGGVNVDILNLRTDGNIVQQANAPASMADRINLVSGLGGVAGENNTYFRLQGGQQIVGGDSLSASVNVTANKDIRVQQTTGDLRIGKFHTDNGDVYIAVPQGGIVDALPYVERTPMEENELVDLWKSMGIIADGNGDLNNDKNKALANTNGTVYENYRANVQKAFDRFTAIKDKPEAERTQAEKDILAVYQEQFKKPDSSEYFASADEYLAQDTQAAKLAEIGQTRQETYKVWDKDLLLYQIDDAIVNPHPGIKSSEKEPNIFGKNINISVQNGVGLNSDKVTEINMEHLDKNSLKFLSQVDPSTVKWKTNESNESIAVITDRLAIGLQQSGVGSINITTAGNAKSNVFLENRLDDTLNLADPYKNLDIAKILAGAGNVTVSSLGSIYDVNTLTGINVNGYATVATISGNNVMLMTGETGTNNGNIGTEGNFVRLNMSGNLTATATGNIYLEQAFSDGVAKDLNIVTMTAGNQNGVYSADSGNIYLRAGGNIYGVLQDSRVQGYLRSDSHGEIVLDAYGNIGYAKKTDGSIDNSKTLRIKNADVQGESGQKHDSISVRSVTGSINLEGVSTEPYNTETMAQMPGGYLNILELSSTAGDVVVTLNGTLNLKSDVNLPGKFVLNINTDAELNKNITAKDIEITGTNNIVLANGITLKAENVILTAGQKPVLSYGTVATSLTEGASIRQGESFNYEYIKEAMDFSASGHAQAVFDSTSKIQANHLQASATTGIYLRGKNDCNDVVLHNVQEHVVYHNMADVDPLESGDVLTVNISNANATDGQSHPVIGSVWVYNQAITPATSSENFAKPMAVTDGIYSLGDVVVKTDGSLANLMEVTSKQGNIYLGSELETVNRGMIKAENGYVAIGADGINNYAAIDASKSIFLLSTHGIYNGKQELQNQTLKGMVEDNTVHTYAGDDVLLLTVDGLDNRADLSAGINNMTNVMRGGDVFLDDAEILTSGGLLDADTLAILQELLAGYWSVAKDLKSNATIKNCGTILASKGEHGKGLVHMDSQGRTENEGAIYSLDGAVFMDSSSDLINNRDIYVLNTKTDGTACDVTLQATGNVYNTGNIHVEGKGQVLLDADAVDQDGLDLEHMTPEEIASHQKYCTVGDITFKGVYNTGDIYVSDGDVTFKSMYGGDIYNTDELLDDKLSVTYSNGNIMMNAALGKIENTKALYATGDIEITSKSHIYNLPALQGTTPTEFEGQSIMRGLTSENGDIKLTSNAGAIVNDGIITTMNGDIILTANGYIEYKRLKDENGDGKINFDDLKYGVEGADNKTYEQLAIEYFATEKGLIKAGIYNHTDSDYTANGGNITITSVYAIDASGSFTANSKNKDSQGKPTDGKGNITVTSSDTTYGDIYHYAHTNTQIKEGTGEFISEIYGPGEDAYEMVKADGIIQYSAAHKAYLMTDMIAVDGIKLTFDEGTTLAKEIICLDGNITIQTKGQTTAGDLLVNAKITAGGAVNLISAGNLKFGDEETENKALIDAKGDITLTAERDILIVDATKLETETGGLELTSNKGGIDVTGDITAQKSVRIYTKGDSTQTEAGDYKDRFDGDYTAPAGPPSASIAAQGIKINGNITTAGDVDLSTYDDKIETGNVTATGTVVVGNSEGTISLGDVSGNNVALYSEAQDTDLTVGQIEIGKQLILGVNNYTFDMGNVVSRDDNDVDVSIYKAGPEGVGNLNLNMIGVSEKVHLRNLSVDELTLTDDSPLVIDNLSVGIRAELHVMGAQTDVYGIMHPYDADANMTYYHPGSGAETIDLAPVLFGYNDKGAAVRDLASDPSQFVVEKHDGNNESSSLRFEQPSANVQRYEALLLGKDRGYSVYGQRYSVESVMQELADAKAANIVFETFNTQIQFFNRFDNVAIPDVVVNRPEEWDKDQFEF